MMSRVRILAAALAAACVVVIVEPASAAVWAWGCMGKLGNERVIYNRDTLIVTAAQEPQVKLEDLGTSGSKLETDDGLTFNNLGSGGLQKTTAFEKNDEPGKTLTLTETSSHRTFHRVGHIGKREEVTTKFRKTFRYVLGKEPARSITMQCIEYTLSTCGGPCS